MLWHHCITPIQSAPLRVFCRRGTYYTRAWQAVVARAQGQQHVVQPNTFALQLPHEGAYSRHEASLAAFEAVGACLETGLPLLLVAACWLPHDAGYSRQEAGLAAFQAVTWQQHSLVHSVAARVMLPTHLLVNP